MSAEIANLALRPPLQAAWESSVDLAHVVAGTSAIYGFNQFGKLVALNPATGEPRWVTSSTHLRHRLTVVGDKVYAYRAGQGLAEITDSGSTYSERMLLSINPLTESDPVSNILVVGGRIYMAINQALIVMSTAGSLLGGTEIGSQTPYMLVPAGGNRCVAVDGFGQPQAFEIEGTTVRRLWYTTVEQPGVSRKERPAVVAGTLLITGGNGQSTAFNLSNGSIAWHNSQIGAEAIAVNGANAYLVGAAGHTWAVNAASGAVRWRRMYMDGSTVTTRIGADAANGFLYIGAFVAAGGPIHLFALAEESGEFAWQANSTALTHAAGIPVVVGNRLLTYGTNRPAIAMATADNPRLNPGHLIWAPNPLRGPRTGFAGAMTINLPVRATLTVTAFREVTGAGAILLNRAVRSAGSHTIPWDAGGVGGFSDTNQFGRLLVDVEEEGGAAYTVAKLLPVNTLPDLLGHWARTNIEIMVYKQYIGGYPDLTFRPDGLVTRAESCTIIAKTLGVEAPSSGFSTRFTDIATHWARPFIMALEELGVIGGFQEPDGTFTFRPDRNMTRAEEARILVRAYDVPAAPEGFTTRFTDTAGHWARTDIDALEAAGYINGFQEPNGTFTYRPEQSLTRAELCTVVVRIRNMTRS